MIIKALKKYASPNIVIFKKRNKKQKFSWKFDGMMTEKQYIKSVILVLKHDT